jgi:hypothetical protein
MIAKVKWVNSWKDIPKAARDRAHVDSGSTLVGMTDKGIIYLIKGKASKWMETHEEFHLIKKHPGRERDYKIYVLHELEANMAAYDKYSQPKHILSHLRGIYNDIRFNVYQCTNREALSAIGHALRQVKAPDGWLKDYRKLKEWTRK